MLFWILGCVKQGPIGVPPPAARPSLVYRIEREGRVSHLFGTCHLPLPLEERVDPTLIREAREVWVEADLDPADLLASFKVYLRDDGTYLSDTLDRAVFTTLTRRGGSALPASMLDQMKPWAATVTVGLQDLVSPDAYGTRPALDVAVTQLATASSVPIRTVETTEDQIGLLQSEEVDITALVRPKPRQLEALRTGGQAMIDLCEENDLSQVPRSLYTLDPAMLRDRNHRWMPLLEPSVAQGDAFVAVGALHLPGRDGLLSLFAQQGYTVTNVPRPVAPKPTRTYQAVAWQDPVLMSIEARDEAAARIAEALCGDESMIFRSCFLPDQAACEARLTHDTAVCLDAHYTSIEQLQANPGSSEAFNACTAAGLVAEAMGRGWPEAASCQPLQAAVEAETNRNLTGGGAPR